MVILFCGTFRPVLLFCRSELSTIAVPSDCFSCSDEMCKCRAHLEALNKYYEDIVNALETAANKTIVKLPCSALKVFWTIVNLIV